VTAQEQYRYQLAQATSLVKVCLECNGVLPKASELCPGCGYEFACFTPVTRAFDAETEAALGACSLEKHKAAVWTQLQDDHTPSHAARLFREQFGEWPAWDMTPNSDADKRRFYAQMLQTAQDRGYRIGWAAHKFREKFGEWPPAELRQAAA
jgi:ribosomal protein L40E